MRSLVLRVLAVFGLAAATALLAVPASAREYSRYAHHYVGHQSHGRVVHHRPYTGHRYVHHAPRHVYHAPRHHYGYHAPRRHDRSYAPRTQIVVSVAPRHHVRRPVRYRHHH